MSDDVSGAFAEIGGGVDIANVGGGMTAFAAGSYVFSLDNGSLDVTSGTGKLGIRAEW